MFREVGAAQRVDPHACALLPSRPAPLPQLVLLCKACKLLCEEPPLEPLAGAVLDIAGAEAGSARAVTRERLVQGCR